MIGWLMSVHSLAEGLTSTLRRRPCDRNSKVLHSCVPADRRAQPEGPADRAAQGFAHDEVEITALEPGQFHGEHRHALPPRGHGIRVMSVPRNIRSGPNASKTRCRCSWKLRNGWRLRRSRPCRGANPDPRRRRITRPQQRRLLAAAAGRRLPGGVVPVNSSDRPWPPPIRAARVRPTGTARGACHRPRALPPSRPPAWPRGPRQSGCGNDWGRRRASSCIR